VLGVPRVPAEVVAAHAGSQRTRLEAARS